jgi:hypothetical protein
VGRRGVLAGSAVPRGVVEETAIPNITSLPILAADVLKILKRVIILWL